jgi:hypothetical protein
MSEHDNAWGYFSHDQAPSRACHWSLVTLWSLRCWSLALLLLVAGCSAPVEGPSIPKTGSGLVEYREVTRQAHGVVTDTVDSLEQLAGGAGFDRRLARFDRAFEKLELTSVKARARAEAIIARGQNYFDEWQEQLGVATNQSTAQLETGHYQRLFDHFTRIRHSSSAVREEFRPFMASLRQFRARLDQPSKAPLSPVEIDALTTRGRSVLKALDSVSEALDHAEAELRTLREAKR